MKRTMSARAALLALLGCLLVLPLAAVAEEAAPAPLFVRRLVKLGGRAFDRPLAACPDGEGGCLIVLETSGRFSVGKSSVRSKEVERWAVRLGGDWRWKWAERLESPAGEGDEGFGVCRLPDGGFLVGGLALPRSGKGPLKFFLMGLDLQGTRKFRKRFGSGEVGFYGLCGDGEGGCWFAGSTAARMKIGSTKLDPAGERLYFVARAGADGRLISALPVSRRGEMTIAGVCPDGRGGVWMAGTFSDAVAFGRKRLSSSGDSEVFAARASASGEWLCAAASGGDGLAEAAAVCPDEAGGCWLAGQIEGYKRFGDEEAQSESERDVFAVHLTPGGRFGAPLTRGTMLVHRAAGLCSDGTGGCWLAFDASNARSVRNPNLRKSAVLEHIVSPGRVAHSLTCDEKGVIFEKLARAGDGCILLGTFERKIKMGFKVTLWSRGDDADMFVAEVSPGK